MDRPRASDVVGVGRLAVDAVFGLTDVVEAMHGTISRAPLPIGKLERTHTRGITRLVYQTIRGVTGLVGGGLDAARALVGDSGVETTPRRDVVLAVLDGVIGDHLAATANPLALAMRLRRADDAAPSGRVAVLVHGLCMSYTQWKRRGHDHGEVLAPLGYTRLYASYNSGRHVSLNGRDLAERLEELVASWPVPITELVLIGHSMGGLVSRAACYHARLAGHRWLAQLTRLVTLGTPHHGAPLERAGNLANLLLEISPYAAPLARIGGGRSAGIHDLRYGVILDEDWAVVDRRHRHDPRTPVPLPDGVACYTIAATRGRRSGDVPDRLLGDGLVPVASALGHHADERFVLAFPPDRQRVIFECVTSTSSTRPPSPRSSRPGWPRSRSYRQGSSPSALTTGDRPL